MISQFFDNKSHFFFFFFLGLEHAGLCSFCERVFEVCVALKYLNVNENYIRKPAFSDVISRQHGPLRMKPAQTN